MEDKVKAAEVTMATVADKALDKVETLVTKAAESASNVFEAASNIISKAIEQYGQAAIDAVLWVVRIDAAQQLITAILAFLLLAIFGLVLIFKTKSWFKSLNDMDSGLGVVLIIPYGIFIGFIAYTLNTKYDTITNVWLYTALFKPELYLTKQAIDLAKKKLEAPSTSSTICADRKR
jgi:ABC-type proline/glycine betaine transport system permease subunit